MYPRAEIKKVLSVLRSLEKAEKHVQKSLQTAIKVEGYRLRNLLRKEIRQGRPGGRQLAPLTYIGSSQLGLASKWATGTATNRKRNRNRPLYQLFHGIHYDVTRDSSNPYMAYVGFGEPSQSGSWARRHTGDNLSFSKSWARLAKKHAEGFSDGMSAGDRRFFAQKGGQLSKRTKTRKYYFIKKETRSFRTPARPIIDPFLTAYRAQAIRNINVNFRRKLRGERI